MRAKKITLVTWKKDPFEYDQYSYHYLQVYDQSNITVIKQRKCSSPVKSSKTLISLARTNSQIILFSCLKDEAIGDERVPTGIHVHDNPIVLSRF
jgi:hypothetical protein